MIFELFVISHLERPKRLELLPQDWKSRHAAITLRTLILYCLSEELKVRFQNL